MGPPKPPLCSRTPRACIVTLVELKDWADRGCDPFADLANDGVKVISAPKGVWTPSAYAIEGEVTICPAAWSAVVGVVKSGFLEDLFACCIVMLVIWSLNPEVKSERFSRTVKNLLRE